SRTAYCRTAQTASPYSCQFRRAVEICQCEDTFLTLVVTRDLWKKWANGCVPCALRHRQAFCGDRVERCARCRSSNAGARHGGNGGIVPDLLATSLRVSPPKRLRHTRRTGLHPI